MDLALLRFINGTLANPVFDWLMPRLSWNPLFIPAVMVLSIALLWKGGLRGRLFVILLLLALGIGDAIICASLKHGINRPRPFESWNDIRTLLGRGSGGSMPSSHAANWFSAAVLVWVYYRRWFKFVLPMACLVAFSRIYTGMHYPSDVLAGAMLGVAYASGIVFGLESLWKRLGPGWFPFWHARLASLVRLVPATNPAERLRAQTIDNAQWLRMGYLLTFVVLGARLIYLASGKIELSEDEAYQWIWSKHLDLSYFSKPPMIAYLQFLGTAIFSDTEFGIRFLSPLITAAGSLMLLRFLAREVNGRAAFWFLLMATAAPLLGVGATLMTIDPPSAMAWAAAMVFGWEAVRRDSTRAWIWCGIWMALGFLSKYTALFQLLSWVVFFALWKPARRQWSRPGPYLALAILALSTVPVVIWNMHHGWIGASHIADRGGFREVWHPTLRFFIDFVVSEFALLNPVFFVAAVMAGVLVWKKQNRTPLQLFFWCMGAPLFLVYLLLTFKSRVHPNWIAPAILPMFCLAIAFWEARWQKGLVTSHRWFIGGTVGGLLIVILLHDTKLIGKITGRQLPGTKDPLQRVWGWHETSALVQQARKDLLKDGKPVFIIGAHYGITGLMTFYIPEAKAAVVKEPFVYYQSTDKPENQFYFWPGYQNRKGQNAIYIVQVDDTITPPERLKTEFESVTDLGAHDIVYRGRVMRRFQLFACRNLR